MSWLNILGRHIWGPPTIILLVGTGLYMTVLLKGLQFQKLGRALYLAFVKREEKHAHGDVSHFQALMMALAATVGIGNIAGVATALSIGGPGALFWMWITGLVGMATKYSEAVLAVKYRIQDKFGDMCGGPMYYLSRGLHLKWLGMLFSVFTAMAAFGIGNMVQSNSVAAGLQTTLGIAPSVTGVLLALLTGSVILGGIRSIARASAAIVPVMIAFYVCASLVIVVLHVDQVPRILMLVFRGAFSPTAAAGGFLGASVMQTMRIGVARGIFSNESGLGSSPIAAAAARTSNPVTQALVSMTQTFLDTIVVCSMTGFVILLSGLWTTDTTGATLSIEAYNSSLPGNLGGIIVSAGLVFFAYSTLIGWSYYGEKAVEFLLGERSITWYRIAFCILVAVGAVIKLEVAWAFADCMNGLMILPNLVGILLLSRIVASETKKYIDTI